MILLDPDLEPDPAPKIILAKRVGASASTLGSKAPPRDVRLPSARTLSRFLASAQAALRLKGQVTVLLTTDTAIAKLNRQFRGKNKATDVLSFPTDGPIRGSGSERIAGDLAVSVTTALGQAAEQGHSLATEIKVLILHGLLHLAGYDHEVDNGKMARRERVLRAKLKLPLGLIERVEAPKQGARRAAGKPSSGAKAPITPKPITYGLKPVPFAGRAASAVDSAALNDRAKARTLHPTNIVSGAKAQLNSPSLIVGIKTPTHQSRLPKKAKRP
jgi:probable rRNA maturation factor